MVPAFVLIASLLLTSVATAFVAVLSRSRDEARFEIASHDVRARITARLADYVTLLRSGAAYFSATDAVSSEEFEAFVRRLRLDELYPGIQGVGYSVRVQPQDSIALLQSRRADGAPDFRIWPDVAASEEVHTITYLLPLDVRNSAALGYNMFSEPTRRAAMERARDSGYPAVSGKVTLVQEIEGPPQAGFLMYIPVYDEGSLPASVEGRRAELSGFVYAPFRTDDLFEGIFGEDEITDVAFRVYDGATLESEMLLHDSRRQGVAPDESAVFTASETIEVAGRQWTLSYATTSRFESHGRIDVSVIVFFLGLGTSVVLYLLTRRQAKARSEAELMAVQLRGTSAELAHQVQEIRKLNEDVEASNRDLGSANQALQNTNRILEELRREADTARDEADEANRAKSDFLAAMSHELRTPLNAIMGYAELMEMGVHGPVSENQRISLERIKRSQAHLLSLINDILNYAKIEAGRVEVQSQPIILQHVLSDLEAMTELQIRAAGLDAHFEACDEGLVALGDQDKVQQILLNLITNATKFTPASGRVDVHCEVRDTKVQVVIADTGPGIPRDRISAIFDPFVQLDRAKMPDGQQGVGLGLAISRDLALMMGGDITVVSELSRGSRFTLSLPAAAAEPETSDD